MRKFFLATTLLGATLCFAQDMTEGAAAAKRFDAFVRTPNAKGLAAFKQDCANNLVHSELLEKHMETLLKKSRHSVVAARALFTMRLHCADGALAEDLEGLLGVQMLTQAPRSFLAAASEEGVDPETLASLAGATGGSGAGEFLDCDATCVPRVKKFFAKKERALKAISASGKRLETKSVLIEEIRKAGQAYVESFSAPSNKRQ